MFLTGKAGVGKTAMTESFAKAIGAKCLFVQCYPGMSSDNFYVQPNIEGILRNDSLNAVKKGILIKAIEATTDGDVVVVIDEIDKTRSEVDAFLLDFIQNGRISTGTEIYKRSSGNIWLFITSNGDRDISAALLNRLRKIELKMSTKEFLSILNLPEDHYLGMVFEKDTEFSIRQAKSYIDDLICLGKNIMNDLDIDLLSQYISSEIEIESLEDFERFNSEEDLFFKHFEPLCYECTSLNKDLVKFKNIKIKEDDFSSSMEYMIIPSSKEELMLLLTTVDSIKYGWFKIPQNISKIRYLADKNGIKFGFMELSDSILNIVAVKENIYVQIENIKNLCSLTELEYFKELENIISNYPDYEEDDEDEY